MGGNLIAKEEDIIEDAGEVSSEQKRVAKIKPKVAIMAAIYIALVIVATMTIMFTIFYVKLSP